MAGRAGNQEMSRDHPSYSIVKIGKDTEKSPRDSDSSESLSIAGVKNTQVTIKIITKNKTKRWLSFKYYLFQTADFHL